MVSLNEPKEGVERAAWFDECRRTGIRTTMSALGLTDPEQLADSPVVVPTLFVGSMALCTTLLMLVDPGEAVSILAMKAEEIQRGREIALTYLYVVIGAMVQAGMLQAVSPVAEVGNHPPVPED